MSYHHHRHHRHHQPHVHEKKPLTFFASPLVDDHHGNTRLSPPISHANTESSLEGTYWATDTEDGLTTEVEASAQELRDMSAFHRHSEATTQELLLGIVCKKN